MGIIKTILQLKRKDAKHRKNIYLKAKILTRRPYHITKETQEVLKDE